MVFSLDHPIRHILHKSLFLCYFHINNSLHRMVTIMHLQMTNRTESMLRITTEKKRGKIFLGVEGRLAGPWGGALEPCRRGVAPAAPPPEVPRKPLRADLLLAPRTKPLMSTHPPSRRV